MNGIINFIESPSEIVASEAPKKAKLSSRSFELIKKAASKIKASLAVKMEAREAKLSDQYQEAHEIVREAVRSESMKDENEYNGDKLQRLTNELGSIGVKLILSDYAATRLSVQGQPKAIKMPNFWKNIKETLSVAHLANKMNKKYKDIGQDFKAGNIEKGIKDLNKIYNTMYDTESSKIPVQNEPAQEVSINQPVEQPKPTINIDDYLKKFAPETPSLEQTNKELDEQLATATEEMEKRTSAMMENLTSNEPTVQPVEPVPVEDTNTVEASIKQEPINSEPDLKERDEFMRGLIEAYGPKPKVEPTIAAIPPAAPIPALPPKGSTLKLNPEPEHSIETEAVTKEPIEEETREEIIREVYIEQTMKEIDKRIKVEQENAKLRREVEELTKMVNALRSGVQVQKNEPIPTMPKQPDKKTFIPNEGTMWEGIPNSSFYSDKENSEAKKF